MFAHHMLFSRLDGSSIGINIRKVDEVYAAFTEKFRLFTSGRAPECPPGCGRCCEGFEPDILPAEAEYLAAALLLRDPERDFAALSEPREPTAVGCPLYRPDNPEHCPAYEARPLICRSFAFSSFPDKHGIPVYRLCSQMPSPRSRIRSWRGEEICREFGAPAPAMERYGRMIEMIGGHCAKREPLGKAVFAAAAKIRYYLANIEPPEDRDDRGAA